MNRYVLALGFAALGCTEVRAMTYFLQADLGVFGFQHVCRYSDGKNYAFQATELCPVSINIDGFSPSGVTGFKSGEYIDGMTKVCVYNVFGKARSLRLDSYEICPMSYEF